MNVKALVFDVDGVLVEPWGFANYLKLAYPAIAPQTAEFFHGVFGDCLVGKADMREVLPPFLEKWGWPHSLDTFLQLWFEMEKEVDARLLHAVAAARSAGIRCYVATNQEKYRVAYMREQMRFDTYFDGVYSSAQIGVKKPELRFFEAITADVGVAPSQMLFWDDTLANVDAARIHGWQAEYYSDYARFAEQFHLATGIELLVEL